MRRRPSGGPRRRATRPPQIGRAARPAAYAPYMLVHLRLTTPTDLTDDAIGLFDGNPAAANLVVQRGVCMAPPGDLVEVDIAREVTSAAIDDLDQLGLGRRGGIVVSQPVATPFDAAGDAEQAAAGDPDDAVIWDEVKEQARSGARATVTFHVFLVIAVALASIAVITDSAVLVVGAMVVGPEFATIASLCTGIVFFDVRLVLRALRLLLLAFLAAIVIVTLAALVGRAGGLITPDLVTRPRPQTGFIWKPDTWSFIVALLAGAAGVLAMTTEKAQAMVGVFISVTTVPAAGNLALALAVGAGSEMAGSATQLGLNLGGMTLAGVITLIVQRLTMRRMSRLLARLVPSPPR